MTLNKHNTTNTVLNKHDKLHFTEKRCEKHVLKHIILHRQTKTECYDKVANQKATHS